jgi:tetratricopeptide (TPR) repeat protein
MSRSYEPFEIEIDPKKDGQYPLQVRFLGLKHEASIPGDLPLLSSEEIEQARTWLERGFIDRSYAQDFGTRLFRTLFPATVEQFFREALQRVEPEGGLRILLNQPIPDELAAITWELLYDPEGLGFLARSTRAPLVRHFTDLPLPHELPVEGPLSVLVVTASPAGKPPVSTQAEIDSIAATLSKSTYNMLEMFNLAVTQLQHHHSFKGLHRRLSTRRLVEMEVLKGATRNGLQNRLLAARSAGKPFHIIHFIGHAEQNEDGSFLLLEDGPILAEDFAEIVAEPSVNLVVLNACETAASGLLDSVAEACLRRSVPVVIGMQVPVLDRAAVEFAREFYSAWAGGEPVESALAYARRLVSQETPGAAADWSIPILYMGPEEGLQLLIKPPAIQLPIQVKVVRWSITAMLSLLATTALLLQVPDIARAVRQQVPGVRCTFPYPLQDDPSFNVAMVEFSMKDEAGNRSTGKDGQAVAKDLYRRLEAGIEELNLPISYDLGAGPYPCPIRGDTPEEIELAAESFARKVNADVLVYGSIVDRGKFGEIHPEFHVNYTGFSEGIEVVGEYQIGKPLRVDIPIQESDLTLGQNKALKARNTALINLVIGLAEYSLDDYDAALQHFQAAEAQKDWLKSQGKEIVYNLIGNTYARKAGQVFLLTDETYNEYLSQAQGAFEQALAINPNYARGQLGMAFILYQQSLGSLNNVEFDLERLTTAEKKYRDLLALTDLPVSAHIPARAHFGLGQIYMARGFYAIDLLEKNTSGGIPAGLNPPEQEFARAAVEFEQVIGFQEAGEDALLSVASQSHANLGLIARLNGDFVRAIEQIKKAIDLSSPYYRVRFYAMLGDTYQMASDVEQAIQAYQDGIAFAETTGDEKSIEQLQGILQKIQP